MSETGVPGPKTSLWRRGDRPFTRAELLADGVVHGVGIAIALAAGAALLILAAYKAHPGEFAALVVYVIALLAVLSISLAFNLWPVSPVKDVLARFDQAAIFLFIAATYTPFLALIGATPAAITMAVVIWSASLVGMGLKLAIPHRFGRLAILLYLAIGWSGIVVFQTWAVVLPPTALWLIVAGGVVYTLGIIFHLLERLRFQNAVWHVFVVAGAVLHLAAILECMVLSRA